MAQFPDLTDDDLLASYSFELPEELIAQAPPERRDGSRLLVVGKGKGVVGDALFTDLPDFLPEGALLVANNSKVLPARLLAKKPTGGSVEFLLLTPLPLIEPEYGVAGWRQARVEGLLRASKKPKPGDIVAFAPDLELCVVSRGEFGHSAILLRWQGELQAIFERIGHMPLPPYIRRPDSPADRDRYQTLHASADKQGSVAAPTAGLHFTPEVRARLAARGVEWAEVSLHVGYGTFSPVRVNDIREHRMHQEFLEMPPKTADMVLRARKEGRPVFAVGTTSARALEGAYALAGEIRPVAGWTDIFIRPGRPFAVIDGMLTNFHLPGSSLVIMVAALAGKSVILSAYAYAISRRFRFFSYGDAMLIR